MMSVQTVFQSPVEDVFTNADGSVKRISPNRLHTTLGDITNNVNDVVADIHQLGVEVDVLTKKYQEFESLVDWLSKAHPECVHEYVVSTTASARILNDYKSGE